MEAKDTNNYSHDRMLEEMFLYVHNTYREARGLYFHVPNECRPYPGENKAAYKRRLNNLKAIGTVPGTLDHVFYWKGRLFAFDAKKGKDGLSPEQKIFIENIRLHGGDGWEVRDLEHFKALINQIIKK